MIYKKQIKEIEVCTSFNGEDVDVGIIKIFEGNYYSFKDSLFENTPVIKNSNLETLKLKIESFYSSRDWIERVELNEGNCRSYPF